MAQQVDNPQLQILDGAGNPVPNAKLSFFEYGASSVAQKVYGDQALTDDLGEFIYADGEGYVQELWIGADYRVEVRDSNNVFVGGPSNAVKDVRLFVIDSSALADGSVTVAKIETLGTAEIIIGTTTGNAKVVLSGDVTMSETGVVTIAIDSVTTPKILDEAVTETKLSTAVQAKLNALNASPVGLYIANRSSAPTTDLDVSAGYTADQSGVVIMNLAASVTQINNPIGTGDGGFPSSLTLTNGTWYHVFIVSESDGSNPRLGFDTSLTAVNVLADWTTVEGETYDKYKRIGSVEYDSNMITAFTRIDDDYYFDGSLTVTNGIPTSLTAFTCWSPTGISSAVQLYSRMRSSGSSNTDLSLRMQDATVSSGDVPVNHLFDNGTNNTAANSFEAITDTSSQVSFRYLSNTNLVSVSIQQRSYTDKRIES